VSARIPAAGNTARRTFRRGLLPGARAKAQQAAALKLEPVIKATRLATGGHRVRRPPLALEAICESRRP